MYLSFLSHLLQRAHLRLSMRSFFLFLFFPLLLQQQLINAVFPNPQLLGHLAGNFLIAQSLSQVILQQLPEFVYPPLPDVRRALRPIPEYILRGFPNSHSALSTARPSPEIPIHIIFVSSLQTANGRSGQISASSCSVFRS